MCDSVSKGYIVFNIVDNVKEEEGFQWYIGKSFVYLYKKCNIKKKLLCNHVYYDDDIY